MKYLLCYLLVINLVLFILMGVDKRRAKKHLWRIPEKTLLLLAAVGGSVGGIAGMLLFRHKTKHPQFFIGYPLILIIQLVVAWFLIFRT